MTESVPISKQFNTIIRDIGRQVVTVASRAIDEDEQRESGAGIPIAPELVHRQLTARNLLGALTKGWVLFLLTVALLPLVVVLAATRNAIHFSAFALYLPMVCLFVWAKFANASMTIKEIAVHAAIGFTVEFTIVLNGVLVCSLICFTIYAIFTLNSDRGAQDPNTVFGVYSAILTLAVVLPEEGMKFAQTANFFPYGCLANPRRYNLVNVAATIGFATASLVVQCLLFFASVPHIADKQLPDRFALQLLGVAVVVLIPTHLLSMYQIGMNVSRRLSLGIFVNKLQILAIPTIFRAVQMYSAFIVPLFFPAGSFASELSLYIGPAAVLVFYFIVVKVSERTLPTPYLDSVGYLSFFGLCRYSRVTETPATTVATSI